MGRAPLPDAGSAVPDEFVPGVAAVVPNSLPDIDMCDPSDICEPMMPLDMCAPMPPRPNAAVAESPTEMKRQRKTSRLIGHTPPVEISGFHLGITRRQIAHDFESGSLQRRQNILVTVMAVDVGFSARMPTYVLQQEFFSGSVAHPREQPSPR
jgi:hypothetical protein